MQYSEFLPKNFSSWIRFYLEVIKYVDPKVIDFKLMIDSVFKPVELRRKDEKDAEEFLFSLEFVKQKAFEEMLLVYKEMPKKRINNCLNMCEQIFDHHANGNYPEIRNDLRTIRELITK